VQGSDVAFGDHYSVVPVLCREAFSNK